MTTTFKVGDHVRQNASKTARAIVSLDGDLAKLDDGFTCHVNHLSPAGKEDRELSEWEAIVSAELAPLGFRYFPHPSGSGYWLNQRHSLYLTNDLEFNTRGTYRAWNLTLVEGLTLGKMRFGDRKRKPESIAEDIARKIQRLFDTPDWRNLKEWGKHTL